MKGKVFALSMLVGTVAACQQLPGASPPSSAAAQARGQARAAPDPAEFDRKTAQVQENMRKMEEQMAAVRQTEDPQARQRLLREHWATMQSSMAQMQEMWGPGMMGCCESGPMMRGGMTSGGMPGGHMGGGPMMGRGMGWKNMGEYYASLTPEQLKQRQYMTEQYMAMQHMMMNHMMQHQQWMNQAPGAQR